MADWGWIGGFLRLSFSFSAGLLMSRTFRPRQIRGAFWICAAAIAVLMALPYPCGPEANVANGIYDSVCTLLIFPAIVYIGACGKTTDRFSTNVCEFLGRLSYPIYIIHYPVMYLFYAWVWSHGYTFGQVWPVCAGLFVAIVTMAYVALRFYDEPARRYLSNKFLKNRGK